jgi:hypothetical protein
MVFTATPLAARYLRSTTPRIVVVADDMGTRTWFAHLPGVAEALDELDLSCADVG